MLKKTAYLFLVLSIFFFMSGCMVAESKYLKKEAEAASLGNALNTLSQKHEALIAENVGLKVQKEKMSVEMERLKKDLASVSDERSELDKVLKMKSDDLTKKIADLRQQNAGLQQDIANLKKSKEQEVQAVSKTYGDLLKEMKGEVAKGQIKITELQGKLTLDVVDEVLFDSGVAEIKSEGLAVLQRVVGILKNVNDKTIRIEGHTDDRKIGGMLSKKYATNWELSAARAINVTRYLENQGIDPKILSAAAFGEFQPVADNSTPEGRAKNRRIAIVLLPLLPVPASS